MTEMTGKNFFLIVMIDACLPSFQGNETMATIQNVISVIEGKEEPERYDQCPKSPKSPTVACSNLTV